MIYSIYIIWNKVNNKFYIGSAVNYKKRWRNHITTLNNGTHRNKYLQNAWNKYGEKCFNFEVLEFLCNRDVLLEREQRYIDIAIMISRNNLYNINLVAGGFHNRKHTIETKKKMSLKRIGVSLTKGENNPNSKLTKREVNEIRSIYSNNLINYADLGKKYGVTYQTISAIIKNKIWRND